ncbi:MULTISPECIES: DNA/RNA helicase domain-containing protein [unclassified Micromonospora]|uniref:DNA/RNA helicase domain-containing protein n=1 Tax=unclassified Micromonospora TaxID=2617518 RepID=UPI00331C2301
MPTWLALTRPAITHTVTAAAGIFLMRAALTLTTPVARDGRLVTRRDESKDRAFRSRRSVSDDEADLLIRNTYKVLLTRGMRGTVLYSTDAETREFLASLVRLTRSLETVYEPVAPGVVERRIPLN